MTNPPWGDQPDQSGQPEQSGQPAPQGQDPYQPYGAPSPYGQAPQSPYGQAPQSPYGAGGYPSPYATAPRTNGMAVGSMVTSIVGLLFVSCYGFGGLIGLVGAILGHVAKKQIRANNEGGGGIALAGIIVGWISVALMIIIWVAIGIFLATSWEDMDDSTY